MKPQVRYMKIDADQAGQRLDNYLLRICRGVPRSHVYKAIRGGQVRVNKRRIQAGYRLEQDDLVRIPPMRMVSANETPPAPPQQFPIVYEDHALMAINKPAGVAVHGGSGLSFGVIEQLRAAYPEQRFLELAHRLDRETSGVLVIAKQRRALRMLHQTWRQAQGRRLYEALVWGDWVNDRQHLRQPLLKWLTPHGERRVRVDPQGKPSHTIITLKRRFGEVSWLSAELRTGRTHQIRVHLAAAGYPVLCDEKYGPDAVRDSFSRRGYSRMFLHATELHLPHPLTGEPLILRAPLPDIFEQLIHELEKTQ